MSAWEAALQRLGVSDTAHAIAVGSERWEGTGDEIVSRSPIDGRGLLSVRGAAAEQVEVVIERSQEAFALWKRVPAPRRAEVVRRFALLLRERKEDLATVVTHEVGKITQEALGEVQEMIDIADFAVGLSRQLSGPSMPSERPLHRLTEQWHPLGPVGVITAFNFPVAVFAWNAMLAMICGDPVVYKPSDKAPLSALATHALAQAAVAGVEEAPDALFSLLLGGKEVGQALASSRGLPLISATGSVPMGRAVGQAVAARLGRSLLELGGNNAMIVAPSARLELAVRSIVFAAVGTAGQRCTTLRRLIVHESVAPILLQRLTAAYGRLPVGDPREVGVLIGPLIDRAALEGMQGALSAARAQGGTVHGGELVTSGVPEGGAYVRPAIVEIGPSAPIVLQETFAPVLYFMRYRSLEEAIRIHNGVPQGLSSAIFTDDVREAEIFCSALGSDAGIANVNIGTSGAEIGGAFGGEKDTGGGRESGSDAWKSYMRRVTNTVNYSDALPLAQGIHFDID